MVFSMWAFNAHKFGFKKRKEQKERKEREGVGLQAITQVSKSTNKCWEVENDDELCVPSTSKLEAELNFQADKIDQESGQSPGGGVNIGCTSDLQKIINFNR